MNHFFHKYQYKIIYDMEFYRFNDFVKNDFVNESTNDFHFETTGNYKGNRKEIDDVLYECVCNYKDDSNFDQLEISVDGLVDYINEDNQMSSRMKKELCNYIDMCEESIEDIFEEICE